jgi:anti-anti-sigma regulatory factor
VIDLEDVTRVDESGKRILASMKDGGAELFATGVSMKYLIRDLRKKREVQ